MSNNKEFVSEAEEIVDSIAQCLMDLEAGGDSPKPEVINTIFRSAHTLKGMSGMVGFNTIQELSHKLEDLLDEMRMGRMQSSPEIMDILFQGLDLLREMIGQVSQGDSDAYEIEPLLAQIRFAMSSDTAQEANPLEDAGISPDLIKVLTEYETYRLSVCIENEHNLLEVKTSYPLETFDTDLSGTTDIIAANGEVLATLPAMELSTGGSDMLFNLVVSTRLSIDELKEVLKGRFADICNMGYKKADKKADTEKNASEAGGDPQQSIKSISSTLRVEIESLDILLNVVGELVLAKAVVNGIAKDMLQEQGLTDTIMELQKSTLMLDRRVGELQEGLIGIRMVPVKQVFDRLTRVVRKTAKSAQKEINLKISGEETKLDKSMIEEIADPLMHLIRNSIDHGVEDAETRAERGKDAVGVISLFASQKGSNVVLEVRDDGGGIDLERVREKAIGKGMMEPGREYSNRDIINQLFQPGFSTASQITEISGRGVGLDVVAKNVAKLGGRVDVDTELGKWTRFTISLPITLIIIKALIVSSAAEIFALPLNAVSESLIVEPSDIFTIEKREVIRLRDQTLPLVSLAEMFRLKNNIPFKSGSKYVVVVGIAEKKVGIIVDFIAGQQEIVIKTIGDFLENIPGIAGATELGNRKTILVLDVSELIEETTG